MKGASRIRRARLRISAKLSRKAMNLKTHEEVRQYYSTVLSTNKDLQTNACCTAEAFPDRLKEILPLIDDEVLEKFYGCGSPIPPAIEGCTILDLGCGSGRDVYLCSKLVGPSGMVIGIDMTEEQLAVAGRHVSSQMSRFGYSQPNVDFRRGYIEDLREVDIRDNSVDIVISNCVINLSPAKERVFAEIFRVLKPGGELYFSDVFASRRIPEALQKDEVLYGECLSGALYAEDFRRMLASLGCPDSRVVQSSPISIENAELKQKLGSIRFTSRTVRAFKSGSLEDRCEDYGQLAVYRGTIPECPTHFTLDDHHLFETGRPMLVCGNTAAMLEETRFAPHFEVRGDRSTHFGLFDCGPDSASADNQSGSCC